MSSTSLRTGTRLVALGLLTYTIAGPAWASPDKIPITTGSKQALELYLQGRDLLEKLRATDARVMVEKAVAQDPKFALGHLALANTAPSAREFFDALKQAVALAGAVSEGERHLILGLDAGARSDPAGQRRHYEALVAAFPNDERAHNLLGGFHFGRQEYEAAISHYERCTAIAPGFSQPYNQMGYSYRFLGKYDKAEQAFKKYVELIPGDPNPYDSYAELLMKTGRFEDSIAQYRKALALDPHFVASYVGIGIDQTLLGQPDKARETFAKLGEVARNSGERRTALFQIAWSYLDEGAHDKALDAVAKMSAIAEQDGDGATVAGDQVLVGNILLDAGRADEALARFGKAVELIERANVPEEVKATTRRNALYNQGRVALARQDVATAKARAAEYAKQVAVKQIPFEVRQSHELNGLVASAEKEFVRAIAELEQANQLDPRVSFELAQAYRGKGDAARASAACKRAAQDNGLNFNLAYVRRAASRLLASM